MTEFEEWFQAEAVPTILKLFQDFRKHGIESDLFVFRGETGEDCYLRLDKDGDLRIDGAFDEEKK